MKARVRSKEGAAAIFIIALLVCGFSAAADESPDPAGYQVFLFEDIGFGGQTLSFTYDNDIPDLTRWNLPTGGKWNDRISSIKVGSGTSVTLYEHRDYGGSSILLEGDGEHIYKISDLHRLGWGDTVSSLKVRRSASPGHDQVFLFEHVNYDGAGLFLSIGQDIPDLRQWIISGAKHWNDRISSLKIGKNAQVYLYTDIDFGGPAVPFKGNGLAPMHAHTLHPYGWGDKVSSLKVRAHDWTPESELPPPPEEPEEPGEPEYSELPVLGDPVRYQVFLFEKPEYGGQSLSFTYDNDIPDLTRWNLPNGEKWNDKIGSIKVGRDTRVILYQHVQYGGASIAFEGDGTHINNVPNLHNLGWGNMISSFKVRRSLFPEASQIFLFEYENYDGAGLYLTADRDIPDLRQLMISSGKSWNDRINSLKIGKDVTVYLYTDIGYGGTSIPYSGDGLGYVTISSLRPDGWGSKVSSLKVRSLGEAAESEIPEEIGEQPVDWSEIDPEPHQVIFFEDVGFGGKAIGYEFDSEVRDLTKLLVADSTSNWNDRISSIKVGRNAKVVLYEHIGCDDRSNRIVIQGDGRNIVKHESLHTMGWGDTTSSFKVRMSDYYGR